MEMGFLAEFTKNMQEGRGRNGREGGRLRMKQNPVLRWICVIHCQEVVGMPQVECEFLLTSLGHWRTRRSICWIFELWLCGACLCVREEWFLFYRLGFWGWKGWRALDMPCRLWPSLRLLLLLFPVSSPRLLHLLPFRFPLPSLLFVFIPSRRRPARS